MCNFINVKTTAFSLAFKAVPDFIVLTAPIGSVNIGYSGGLINGGAPVSSAALPALLGGIIKDLVNSSKPGRASDFNPGIFNGLRPEDFSYSGVVTKLNAPAAGTLNITIDSEALLEVTNYLYYNSYGDYVD